MHAETITHLPATLSTERLILRPLNMADAGHIALYASDAKVARMTTRITHPLLPGATEAFVANASRPCADKAVWAITLAGHDSDQPIGLVGLGGTELGYWIGAPFWNAGFATEALRGLVACLFTNGLARLTAEVFQDNTVSARLLTRLGFTYRGEGEAYSVARKAMVPLWHYDLERTRWQS